MQRDLVDQRMGNKELITAHLRMYYNDKKEICLHAKVFGVSQPESKRKDDYYMFQCTRRDSLSVSDLLGLCVCV